MHILLDDIINIISLLFIIECKVIVLSFLFAFHLELQSYFLKLVSPLIKFHDSIEFDHFNILGVDLEGVLKVHISISDIEKALELDQWHDLAHIQ